VIVLGPQRRPTLEHVALSLPPDGLAGVVTAGWQERESEDDELRRLLNRPSVNLGLYARWMDVLEQDREYAVAEMEHRAVLDELQQLYLVQLDGALQALSTLSGRPGGRPRLRTAAAADALAAVRLVDQRHLARVAEVNEAFTAAWRPAERPVIAARRQQVQQLLEPATFLVVAGGHVGVLLSVLRLFGIHALLPGTLVAWSAGAMAVADRVVLFHDRAPHGPAHPELYDAGLGLAAGVVFLPHARRRLVIEDLTRMSVLARRAAPAYCVVLDDGTRLDLAPGGLLPPGTRVIGADGRIVALEQE
jgi:hypothetical protein